MFDVVIVFCNINEVVEVLKVCNIYKIFVYVCGFGINFCVGICLFEGGIVFIFCYMNNILEIDEENLIIIV